MHIVKWVLAGTFAFASAGMFVAAVVVACDPEVSRGKLALKLILGATVAAVCSAGAALAL